MHTYSTPEAARILGLKTQNVLSHINRGTIKPIKECGKYRLTDKDLDKIRAALGVEHQPRITGLRRNKKWVWDVSIKPEIYFRRNEWVQEQMRYWQNRWAVFLNGCWTKTKPNIIGIYVVLALDKLEPQYRKFETLDEIDAWMGWFWSYSIPLPPTIVEDETCI